MDGQQMQLAVVGSEILLCLAVYIQVLVEEGVAEKFIGLDMSDAESVFQRCLDSINTVREVGDALQACMVRSSHLQQLRFQICHPQKLGLGGLLGTSGAPLPPVRCNLLMRTSSGSCSGRCAWQYSIKLLLGVAVGPQAGSLFGRLCYGSTQPSLGSSMWLQELGTVDGVLSFCEMAQPLVARLAEHLGLPANSPEVQQCVCHCDCRRGCTVQVKHSGAS